MCRQKCGVNSGEVLVSLRFDCTYKLEGVPQLARKSYIFSFNTLNALNFEIGDVVSISDKAEENSKLIGSVSAVQVLGWILLSVTLLLRLLQGFVKRPTEYGH